MDQDPKSIAAAIDAGKIISYDLRVARNDRPGLQTVVITIEAPPVAIELLRYELERRTYADDSEPPAVGVALPFKG